MVTINQRNMTCSIASTDIRRRQFTTSLESEHAVKMIRQVIDKAYPADVPLTLHWSVSSLGLFSKKSLRLVWMSLREPPMTLPSVQLRLGVVRRNLEPC